MSEKKQKTKINSRFIQNSNVRSEIIKLLAESIDNTLLISLLAVFFLDQSPLTRITKVKINLIFC